MHRHALNAPEPVAIAMAVGTPWPVHAEGPAFWKLLQPGAGQNARLVRQADGWALTWLDAQGATLAGALAR
jgi:hypothetical protein